MAKQLRDRLCERLIELKKAADLTDTQVADAMRQLAPGMRVYQQKVNDFFNGEMKKPDLDFLAILCGALGVKLSSAIAALELDAPIERTDDWEWLMFGRRIGRDRRVAARAALEEPSDASDPSPLPRPARRKPSAGVR